MTTPETLSFDGRSVIRSDEYRTAAAELNRYQTPEQIAYYGNLFASAPALYAALENAESAIRALVDGDYDPDKVQATYAECRAALALARGEKGGEVK